MALKGWILDKSAAARSADPQVGEELAALAGLLFVCPIGELEQLYSTRSARDYDELKEDLHANVDIVSPPGDTFERAPSPARPCASSWHVAPHPDPGPPDC